MKNDKNLIAPHTATAMIEPGLQLAPEAGEPVTSNISHIVRRVGNRLMWLLVPLYFCAMMDRGNISFAALSMNKEIGLTSEMFGMGIGIMFFAYAIFEVPSNLLLASIGARKTLTRIAILWGIATILMAFVQGPLTFYTFRAFLGAAEAGLFPGVMLYLTYWFPVSYRARYNAIFNFAIPMSYVVAAIISGSILTLDGAFGLAGWKWLFILEGLPPIVLGVWGWFYLTDRPADAKWLSPKERSDLESTITKESALVGPAIRRSTKMGEALRSLGSPLVLLLGVVNIVVLGGLTALPYWLPQILRSYGLSPFNIGLASAIPPAVGMAGMIVSSIWSDRHGQRALHTAIAFVISAAGFMFISFASSLTTVMIGAAIVNIGVFSAQAIFWTIPQSFLRRDIAPGALAIVSMIGTVGGGSVLPWLFGWLRDHTNSFVMGFYVIAGVSIAGALLIVSIGRSVQCSISELKAQ